MSKVTLQSSGVFHEEVALLNVDLAQRIQYLVVDDPFVLVGVVCFKYVLLATLDSICSPVQVSLPCESQNLNCRFVN